MLKTELTANPLRKLGAALVMPGLKRIKHAMDYQEYGGAPLLGVKGVSIVCHGSSGVRAIIQAIEVAAACVEKDMIRQITAAVSAQTAEG